MLAESSRARVIWGLCKSTGQGFSSGMKLHAKNEGEYFEERNRYISKWRPSRCL